jgi:hypothetical protein
MSKAISAVGVIAIVFFNTGYPSIGAPTSQEIANYQKKMLSHREDLLEIGTNIRGLSQEIAINLSNLAARYSGELAHIQDFRPDLTGREFCLSLTEVLDVLPKASIFRLGRSTWVSLTSKVKALSPRQSNFARTCVRSKKYCDIFSEHSKSNAKEMSGGDAAASHASS